MIFFPVLSFSVFFYVMYSFSPALANPTIRARRRFNSISNTVFDTGTHYSFTRYPRRVQYRGTDGFHLALKKDRQACPTGESSSFSLETLRSINSPSDPHLPFSLFRYLAGHDNMRPLLPDRHRLVEFHRVFRRGTE